MASFMGYQLTDGKNLKGVHGDCSTLSVNLGNYRTTRGPLRGEYGLISAGQKLKAISGVHETVL
jgi:hypothetical protein